MTKVHDVFLDTGMKLWIEKKARREFWRVAELCDLSDLIQDGYLCYAKCRQAYLDPRPELTGNRGERRWFQSLVKTAFENHIHSLAAKHKGVSVRPISQHVRLDADVDAVWDSLLPSQPEQASFLALLAGAPVEIKQLIQLLANDGLDLLRFERKRQHRRALRETTNEFYCRVLGLDATTTDMVGRVKAYFG